MKINCAWEHNGDSTLLYAVEQVGAYARGRSLTEALDKLPDEIGHRLNRLFVRKRSAV